MKKETLLKILDSQKEMTKKTTRKDIIAVVRDMVALNIKDNAEIVGLSGTRSHTGVNLGEVVEIVAKSLFRNKLEKAQANATCDLVAKGKKVEVKFSTSDAYAHAIDPREIVDYYLIITYTKCDGVQVFQVPYKQKDLIRVNAQGRVITNQQSKFLNKDLTQRLSLKA